MWIQGFPIDGPRFPLRGSFKGDLYRYRYRSTDMNVDSYMAVSRNWGGVPLRLYGSGKWVWALSRGWAPFERWVRASLKGLGSCLRWVWASLNRLGSS